VVDRDAPGEDYLALKREVETLRARVAELQRAAARHEENEPEQLALREELLREAERVAHLGTWTWEPESGRVTWSDEMYRILGLPLGSVQPSVETFFAAVHAEDRERAQRATDQSLKDGVLPLVDVRIVRPDGSIRHTTASSSMLFDERGVPRRIVGGVLDRTERLAAEATLRRTLALLEEAQRFAKLGSWRFDPANGELEWSKEFRRIADLADHVVPDPERFLERIAPEDQQRIRDEYTRRLIAMEDNELHFSLIVADGERRHVRMETFVVQGADGRAEFRGTLHDVTEDVTLRAELARAQKMEAIGRLAGGIAHDFNNLLTVMIGNLELLAMHVGKRAEIELAQQAMASAAGLTRRLLTFGRKAPLSRRWVEPNELVQATTGMLHRLVGDEVSLELHLTPGLPALHVDPVEIERALINLVVNARDAMPRGGTVEVRTAQLVSPHGTHVELAVADEGPGIPEEDRDRIFEPFFTTRGTEGGTGLGLATVLGTAEQHGGTVRVEARPEGGSVFTITLPAAGPADHASRSGKRGVSNARIAAAAGLRVLVIDDQPDVARVIAALLEKRGHGVSVVCDPLEALRTWSAISAEIDLVVCDIAMAGMRGPELVQRMAEQGVARPVLFITGYSEEAAGAVLDHPVLTKPFTPAALDSAIRDALARG
jgi:signal transduction histidine kinase/CheY-like chemotaxis protein